MLKTILKYAAGVAILVIVFVVGASFGRRAPAMSQGTSLPGATEGPAVPSGNCAVTQVSKTVTGDSMAGLVASGTQISIAENYYACHDVARGDIVEYLFGGSVDPLIKVVKGIPGDTLSLAQAKNGWNIVLNGKILATSGGEPYVLGNPATLSLYVSNYQGVLPADGYLILGNVPSGSEDSTKFGLVAKEDFLGKISQ